MILFLPQFRNCCDIESSIDTFLQGNESVQNREFAKELYAEKKPDNMTQEEWDKQQSEKEDDERFAFRVLSLIMEAKRPNDTAFETLLTREALYA